MGSGGSRRKNHASHRYLYDVEESDISVHDQQGHCGINNIVSFSLPVFWHLFIDRTWPPLLNRGADRNLERLPPIRARNYFYYQELYIINVKNINTTSQHT